jgi:hypothetical protein
MSVSAATNQLNAKGIETLLERGLSGMLRVSRGGVATLRTSRKQDRGPRYRRLGRCIRSTARQLLHRPHRPGLGDWK